jgi:hypothetical protein
MRKSWKTSAELLNQINDGEKNKSKKAVNKTKAQQTVVKNFRKTSQDK